MAECLAGSVTAGLQPERHGAAGAASGFLSLGSIAMSSIRRRRLDAAIRAALSLALLPLAAPAIAQDAAPAASPTDLDRVEVTGSRIKRAETEGQVPVQVVSREDIDRSGLTSIGDVVSALTGSGSALNTRFNSSGNFGFSPNGDGVGAGSSQVDLRHLGAKRVLVLVDGLRWVNESSASGVGSATDLNTIPLAIVDRIEVLEDGASSLYGSDAIAGVVNIITRRDFDGASVRVQGGQFTEGDGANGSIDLALGGGNDRLRWFLGASYTDQGEVLSRDREQSAFPVPGTGLSFGSSATPFGRFIITDPNTGATLNLTPNTGAGSNPFYDPSQTGCTRTDDFHCFTTADRFNFAQFNLLVTPSERAGLFGQVRFDVTEDIGWYARALYNRRESVNQAAPEPIFLGPEAGTGNPLADNIVISRLNPFNPFGFDLDSSDGSLILIGRRPVEGGARRFEQVVDTVYVATGFEGAFSMGERSWFWDVNVVRSENSAEQTNFGSYNIRNIALALGDPTACAAVAGCTPLDIWGGPGSITPAMLAFIQPVVRDESENAITQVSANLSGELLDLPAGALAFATGIEYRDLDGSYTPDALTVRGDYNGVPSLPTSGSYDVTEAFGELSIPLFEGAGGERFDLSLAGRYSDYSTFGGEFTHKIGLRFQPADELLFRATLAEGFRAPSIGELFGSASRADLVLDDPCSAPVASNLTANCATLGVPVGYTQPNPQISVLTGGNRDLAPELADSLSLGAVWTPAFLEGTAISERVDIEFTWYRHEVEGAIQAIDAQTQLDLCVATLDPLYCSGITRAVTGGINSFNNRLTNLGSIETDGYDIDLFWTFPETEGGHRFRATWRNTFVGKYEAFGANGQRQPQGPGIEVNDGGIPEWSAAASLDWAHGPWSASWALRHTSELTEDCGDAAGFAVCSDQASGRNTLEAITYHDVQMSYRIDWMQGVTLSAGINNLFDKDPPICLSCSLNGYDPSTYDIPGGRAWYLRADIRF